MKRGNKKGSVHVDWVVSIGIFLTYIILLITFIKPSYEPAFEGDVLVNLIKDSFETEVGWEVNKVLLSFDCDNGGVYAFNLENYIPDVGSKFKVVRKSDNNMAKYSGSLKLKLNNHDDKFWVYYNSFQGYPSGEDPGDESLDMNCEGGGFSIGAANPIVFKGVSEFRLGNLDGDKLSENFPEFRQFKIRILDSEGELMNNYCYVKGLEGGQNYGLCESAQPPADVTVYGVNLGEGLVDKDGNVEQVILNIQTW